jgi:hypothetical protein
MGPMRMTMLATCLIAHYEVTRATGKYVAITRRPWQHVTCINMVNTIRYFIFTTSNIAAKTSLTLQIILMEEVSTQEHNSTNKEK